MPATALSVRRILAVDVPQTRAFDTFVNMSAWWPLDTHTTGQAPARASILQPHAGGRWYEIDKNGQELQIGHVLSYEPPERLLLSWELSCGFDYDPSKRTEIEVRFIAESPTRTRVELEHRGFEAYGEDAERGRALYDGPEAWTLVLARYGQALAT